MKKLLIFAITLCIAVNLAAQCDCDTASLKVTLQAFSEANSSLDSLWRSVQEELLIVQKDAIFADNHAQLACVRRRLALIEQKRKELLD